MMNDNQENMIEVDGKGYQRFVNVTEDIMVENLTLKFEDFKTNEGHIDFKKLDKRLEYYICMFTQYGTGKTFGLSKYALEGDGKLGVLANTTYGAESAVQGILSAFKQDYQDFQLPDLEKFNDGEFRKNALYDGDGELRVFGAGLRTKGNSKLSRFFYPRLVMGDEVNQSNEQAEIGQQDPLQTSGTITGRGYRIDDVTPDHRYDHLIDHIFMFANKDGRHNLLSTKATERLGIYGLSEYTECFTIYRRARGTDKWYPETFVVNPKVDKELQKKMIEKGVSNPKRYRKELADLSSGLADVGVFNDDSKDGIYDNLYLNFEKDHDNLIKAKGYLYNKDKDGFVINLLFEPNSMNKAVGMSHYEGTPDDRALYSGGKPMQDGVKQLNNNVKDAIIAWISEDAILYDKISTRVAFLQKFRK